MTLTTLLLVILASFIHASWNLLAKRAASVGPVFVFAYNVVACVAYAPWVLYIFANAALLGTGRALLSSFSAVQSTSVTASASNADTKLPTCRSSILLQGARGQCFRRSEQFFFWAKRLQASGSWG